MSLENYTKNGEITFDTDTKKYTVWDEVYVDPVCVTPYPKIAEAALDIYCSEYIEGPK